MTNQFIRHQWRAAGSGFTLIELLVTVGIIGILAAIAMPSYTDYLIRGRIPEATSGLASRKVQAEQYFQDSPTHTYADMPGEVPPGVNQGCQADTTSGQFFDFRCSLATSATPGVPAVFTVQAVGRPGGSMDGFTYTIDQNGRKASSIVAPALPGWRAVSPAAPAASCWYTKKGGVC